MKKKSNLEYIKFNLNKLSNNEFVVLLKPKTQKDLIDKAASIFINKGEGWGKYKRLCIYLYEMLSYLKLHNKSNILNIAKIYNKHDDTIRKHLNKGISKGLIEKDTSCWPYKYLLTQGGLNLLEKDI